MEKEDAHFCLRCRSTIIGLDEYVAHRKSEVCIQHQEHQQQSTLYIPQSHEDEDRFSSTHFSSTATDALATEAAFMESIGLYLNPKPSLQLAKVPGLMSPRSTATTSKTYQDERESASRDDWDDVFSKDKTHFAGSPIPDIETSEAVGSKSDFLRQIDLMTVDQNQSGPSGSTPRWRLWQPEQEVAGDDLWSEMLSSSENDLYLETVANDPTLMEMSVSMLTASTPQNIFKSKGKWLSPSDDISCLLDKSNEDASKKSPYFCKTCDRSLSSNNAYSKHLSSELHFKRSSAAVLDEVDSTTRKRTKKLSAAEVIEKVMTDELAEMKMPRKTVFASVNMIICPTCSSRVNRDQFGKHLISHYHHHKSMGHPDNKNLALNYIEEIVMEAPFSCKICNFYCNWNSDFIDHWSGNLHKSCDAAAKEDEADAFAVYWCSFCRFQSRSSTKMLIHLKGEDHSEIVDVINRSVPIVIRRCQLQACSRCSKTFRLKFSLRAHMKSAHKEKAFQLPGHDRHACRFCSNFKTFSEKSIRAHEFLAHPEERPKRGYECRFCFLNFKSKAEAERHRKTLSHRTNVKSAKGISTVVKCQFCDDKVEDLARLKEHILDQHIDEASQCGFCGLKFALPQDLTAHVKSNCFRQIGGEERRKNDTNDRVENDTRVDKCDVYGCQFSCASEAMMLLHQSVKHSSSPASSYTCILCDKMCCTRSKLLEHVRIHVKSSMKKCQFCYKLFESSSQLHSHINKVHQQTTGTTMSAGTRRDGVDSIFFCSWCQTMFEDRKSLSDHMRSCRIFQCPSCPFSTKTQSLFEKHQLEHCHEEGGGNVSNERFSCDECSKFTGDRSSNLIRHKRLHHCVQEKAVLKCRHCNYSTVFKQHLDRHVGVVHPFIIGSAPCVFYCPGCGYSCNALDNLRKHILSTKKHSGMCVYHCKVPSCQYSTNESQEFKRHLSADHLNVFPSSNDVKNHLDNFFRTKREQFEAALGGTLAKTKKNKTEQSRPQQRRKQLLSQRTCEI